MASDEKKTDCSEIHELIPAYCLGATDPGETRRVEAHLAQCREAAADAADYQALSETLLFSAPAVGPPVLPAFPAMVAVKVTSPSVVSALPALVS